MLQLQPAHPGPSASSVGATSNATTPRQGASSALPPSSQSQASPASQDQAQQALQDTASSKASSELEALASSQGQASEQDQAVASSPGQASQQDQAVASSHGKASQLQQEPMASSHSKASQPQQEPEASSHSKASHQDDQGAATLASSQGPQGNDSSQEKARLPQETCNHAAKQLHSTPGESHCRLAASATMSMPSCISHDELLERFRRIFEEEPPIHGGIDNFDDGGDDWSLISFFPRPSPEEAEEGNGPTSGSPTTRLHVSPARDSQVVNVASTCAAQSLIENISSAVPDSPELRSGSTTPIWNGESDPFQYPAIREQYQASMTESQIGSFTSGPFVPISSHLGSLDGSSGLVTLSSHGCSRCVDVKVDNPGVECHRCRETPALANWMIFSVPIGASCRQIHHCDLTKKADSPSPAFRSCKREHRKQDGGHTITDIGDVDDDDDDDWGQWKSPTEENLKSKMAWNCASASSSNWRSSSLHGTKRKRHDV